MWALNDSPNQRREDPDVCLYEKNTSLDAEDDMDKRVRLGSSSNDNSISSGVVLEASDEDDRERKSSSCKIFGFSVNGDGEEDLREAVVTRQFFPVENDGTPLPLPHWAGVKFCQSEPAEAGKSAADVAQPIKKTRRGPRSRSSQYRGVTFYRRTGRWESHIWFVISSLPFQSFHLLLQFSPIFFFSTAFSSFCYRDCGKQVYLGGYYGVMSDGSLSFF